MIQFSSKTIGKIYDAAVNQAAWRGALDGLADDVGGVAASLLVSGTTKDPYSVSALSSAYIDMISAGTGQYYLDHLSKLEAPQFDFISRLDIGMIVRDEQMGISKDTLDRRADYIYLKKHAGVHRRLGFRLNDNRSWFDMMTIGFSHGVTHIPDETIAKVTRFLPHLAKAIELGRTFHLLQDRYQAVLSVLDKVNIGLFLALECGEIIIANREARRVARLQDGISMSRANRIELCDSESTSRLHGYIAQIASTAAGNGDTTQCVLQVNRPSLSHPFLIDVVPVSDANQELDIGIRGALVIAVDPENTRRLDTGTFGKLYRLTEAETEVCDLVIRGFQTGEIAEIRRTKFNTAKNQIAAVFQKTGTQRRGDLIRLVIRTLPPIF